MEWTQVIDPLGNLTLSAFVAAIPVFVIFIALISKLKGYLASLLTLFVALVVAAVVYKMPLALALSSAFNGALYGLFPICWIIIGPVFLFNITVKSGQFEVIRSFMASITPDRRLQGVLIAFSFGAFLEGSAGFGAPVAISASMLMGLGFNPIYAAGICLIANTAPVAFGSVGIPIIVASRVTDIPELAISQMVGRTLPLLSAIIPFYLVSLMAGWRRAMEVLPALVVSGLSFAFFQWFTANYIGPMLPDVMAGIASIVCMMVLLRFWKPKSIWRFEEEVVTSNISLAKYSTAEMLRAWSPFIIMTLFIVAWGLTDVKAWLNAVGTFKFNIPGLQDSIRNPDGSVLVIKPYEINLLSSPGTAVMLATLISIPLMGFKYRDALSVYWSTLKQLRFPILTIASIVGFAFLANYSGMSITMGTALASTGVLFPFFSPILGWLGVFLTGSDTSSNALFCKLQAASADSVGVDPVVTVSANASGGVTGKMASPQSIAVGAAAVGLVGKESTLFRFTLKHSFIMLSIISVVTCLQAYVFTGMIPVYEKLTSITVVQNDPSKGIIYVGILFVLVILIVGWISAMNRRGVKQK
ncbi:MAG: lactate permease LctP family transporter [Chryseolinea sp.]